MDPLAPSSLASSIRLSTTSSPKKAGSPRIKATSSMGSPKTLAISRTKRWTMGFPATGIRGFGTVKVWGLNRDPLPAMGTIIFIDRFLNLGHGQHAFCLFNRSLDRARDPYSEPVLPHPPAPLSVVERAPTSTHWADRKSVV